MYKKEGFRQRVQVEGRPDIRLVEDAQYNSSKRFQRS
jgi:hypothetical protein